MTTPKEQMRLNRLEVELHGPRDHLDFRRVRRVHDWLSHLQHPWDILLACCLIGGLVGLTLLGTFVVIWSWTWMPGILSGVAMVGIAAGISSHLARRRGI